MSLRIVVACALMLIILSIATAQTADSSSDGSFLDIRTGSVSVPLSSLKRPAADLIDNSGRPIDTMEAVAWAKKGYDLSQLNPASNKIWQNRSYPPLERPLTDYPDGEVGVRFISVEADGNHYTAFYRVQALDGSGRYWRLGVSLLSQSATMRSAMLRKLGYDVVTPRPYGRLRVTFSSPEQKQEFIDNLETKDMNLESRGWLLENRENSLSLVLSDAVLETQRNESVDWHWGYIPNPNSPYEEERMTNLAWVEYYSKFRAYRALIVPFSLLFVPESINRYSPRLGSIINDYAILYHPLASGFASASREDIQWLLRRMYHWTEKDYREIVALAHYPDSIKELVYRLTVLRARNLYQLFQMPIPPQLPQVSLDYTSQDGLVAKGRVTKEKVSGYPQRFTHGDRQSPFKDDDWWRYAGIRSRTALISSVLSKLNEKLQLIKMDRAADNFGQHVVSTIQNHLRNKPGQPLEKTLESWSGPLMGFNVSAARHVSTGTYYGSTAAVQLVDVVSVGMNVGYFNTFERFPQLMVTQDGRVGLQRQYPIGMISGNVGIRRDYVHVRPVSSMEEAQNVSWADLMVPSYMNKMAKTLDSQDIKDFRTFIKDLKEGEVFTITDSLEAGIAGRLSTTLESLLAFQPLSFLNTLNIGADAGRVVLRQTNIIKTRGGLQVFVRNQTSRARGVSLDVNYFINLMKLRAQNLQSEILTDAFVIDYKADWSEDHLSIEEQVEKEDQESNLKTAVGSLLRGHGTEHLYNNFQYQKFELEHLLKTKEARSRVLFSQMIDLQEDHELKIRPPRSAEDPDRDPQQDEITLFRRKRGQLMGMDGLGFLTSTVQDVFNHKSPKIRWDLAQPADSNPANLPFGKAYWRQVVTEKDLSGRVNDVAMIQHVWGGWDMKRNAFFKLIDEIIAKLGLPQDAKYDLLDKNTFHNVKSVDFYRITANLSIRKSGIEKIRDLLLQPGRGHKPGDKAGFLSRLFQVLSEKLDGTKSRQADHLIMNDVMKILGDGQLERGRQVYKAQCDHYHLTKNNEIGLQYTGTWKNGSYFDCLTPWADSLLNLSTKYPDGSSHEDQKNQVRWATEVLYVLEEQLSMPQLLKYLGEENVVYLVQLNGFRSGDEDGDLSFISNTWGKPNDDFEEANGVFQFYSRKTDIISTEIDRSQGGFR